MLPPIVVAAIAALSDNTNAFEEDIKTSLTAMEAAEAMDHLAAVNNVLEKTRQFRHVMTEEELREFDSLAGRLRIIEQSIMHILAPPRRGPSFQAQCDAMGFLLLLIAFVLSCCGVF